MNILNQLPLLLLQPESAGQSQSGGIMAFAPLLLMVLVFYFLVMRPQSKKQKETKKMLEAVKKGDKVTTIGGIRGTVDSVKDDVVSVRVDNNTKIDFVKSAISSVLNPASEANSKKEEKASKEKKETKDESIEENKEEK